MATGIHHALIILKVVKYVVPLGGRNKVLKATAMGDANLTKRLQS